MYFQKIVEIFNTQIPTQISISLKIAHRPNYMYNDFVCLCVCLSVCHSDVGLLICAFGIPERTDVYDMAYREALRSEMPLLFRPTDRPTNRPRELGLLLRGSEDQTHCTVIANSPQAARPQAACHQHTEEQALPSSWWVCGWVVGCVYVCVRRACVRGFVRPCVRACVGGRDKEGQS